MSIVDQILVSSGVNGEAFQLTKSGQGWTASNGDIEVPAVEGPVRSILSQLADVKSKRIVTKNPDNWATYETDDAQGTRIEALANGKKLADVVIGTFKFDQTSQSASSYLRKKDDNAVYLVDGFMSMTLKQGFDNYRDKQLVKVNAADVTKLTLQSGENTHAFQKSDDQWYYAGMEQVDSTSMAAYLQRLSSLSGYEFVDGFQGGQNPMMQLEVQGNNMMNQLVLSCYEGPDAEKPFVIHSTMNPKAYFASDSTGIYQNLFGKLMELIP